MQKSALISPIVEADVSEEVIKKVERFLRKVTPLVEKELQENFPLYQRFGRDAGEQFYKRDSRLVHTL